MDVAVKKYFMYKSAYLYMHYRDIYVKNSRPEDVRDDARRRSVCLAKRKYTCARYFLPSHITTALNNAKYSFFYFA